MTAVARAMGLDVDTVEAGTEIANGLGAEASGLVLGIMQASADNAEREAERVRQWEQEKLEEWQQRAIRAEAELALVRDQFNALLFPSKKEIDAEVSGGTVWPGGM